MDRPPAPRPPSALDGYRRLQKAQRPASRAPVPGLGGATAAAQQGGRPHARSSSSARRLRRAAGSLRLLGFVAALAVVVGASVNLASADTSTTAPTPEAPAAKAASRGAKQVAGPREPASAARAASSDRPAAASTGNPSSQASSRTASAPTGPAGRAAEAGAAVVVPAADIAASTAPETASELPLTGEPTSLVLLAGAGMVLLGMLVQIATQPLPARAAPQSLASSRTRRSSRAT